jgi:hypothetical protein
VEELAAAANVTVWGQLPIDPEIATRCDAGLTEEINLAEMEKLVELLKLPIQQN